MPVQEDAHLVELHLQPAGPGRPPPVFFAVFDGHGGSEVAKFAASHMVGFTPYPSLKPYALNVCSYISFRR